MRTNKERIKELCAHTMVYFIMTLFVVLMVWSALKHEKFVYSLEGFSCETLIHEMEK
jgi:hypothetical protein